MSLDVHQHHGKGTENNARGCPKWENEPPRRATVSQERAKGCQKGPKGNQREPRGSQRKPMGSQELSQRATKMHQKIGPRKRSRRGNQNEPSGFLEMDNFGSPFSTKNDEQFDAEIDAEKYMKATSCKKTQNAKLKQTSDICLITLTKKCMSRKRWMYGNHMFYAVECVSARARRERKKLKKRNSCKHFFKNSQYKVPFTTTWFEYISFFIPERWRHFI